MMKEMIPQVGADPFATLPYRTPDPGPITIMTQRIEPFIADALDAAPPAQLPDVVLDGTVAVVCLDAERAIADSGLAPTWLAQWLGHSVSFLARLYGELAVVERIKLRLEPIADDACERFHVDNVRLRLLCTYRGPGSQWLDPKLASQVAAGMPLPASAIRTLDRGAVALIRGSRDPDRPGLVHRSPPLAGTGVTRLLLVVDDAS